MLRTLTTLALLTPIGIQAQESPVFRAHLDVPLILSQPEIDASIEASAGHVNVRVGRPLGVTFTVTGVGAGNYSVVADGLPLGVTVDAGGLTGFATNIGHYDAILDLVLAGEVETHDSTALSIDVFDDLSLTIPEPLATVGSSTAADLATVPGGVIGPLDWTVTPTLPAGIVLSGGHLSGTPEAEFEDDTFTVTITDVDGETAAATFELKFA